jgi:uncharacterized membrane protein YdbT with pleckstrin-like domain
MGYPQKIRHPARIAPSESASFPFIMIRSAIVILPPYIKTILSRIPMRWEFKTAKIVPVVLFINFNHHIRTHPGAKSTTDTLILIRNFRRTIPFRVKPVRQPDNFAGTGTNT